MIVTPISSTLLKRAQALAEVLVAADDAEFTSSSPLPDSFMAHRPVRLAESYRHGRGVARILADWKADQELQAAGLLHSFVCQGALPVERVTATCGERVAFLVREYRDILEQIPAGRARGNSLVVKRVKLFIAAYRDPALAFLGAASLWDHFVVARQGELSLQRSFANEAQRVMIPFLDMLGMWELKEEVEEWIMQHIQNRQSYHYLLKRLAQIEDTHRQAFELIRDTMQPMMPAVQLARKVHTPIQIHSPQFPDKTQPESLQKLTVKVLVNTLEECYTALRWIHHFWKPVEYSVSDYLSVSKLNGYRCLQTAVVLPAEVGHIRVHFHIRTQEMDQINRWGLAALQLLDRLQVELPQAWWSRRVENQGRVFSAPLGSLPETLYVFSPQSQLFRFHRGSTVVDFAYHVHSELGHQCKRFKVNGVVVGPTTVMRHLDLIELERDPKFAGPNQVWLNAARTDRARGHIERFLKRQTKGSRYGQTVIDRQLQALKRYYRIDIPDYRVKQVLNETVRRFKLGGVDDLLAEIAAGRVASDLVLHRVFSEEITRQVQLPPGTRLYPHQLSLAQCCKPRPGDKIIGRSRTHNGEMIGLKIHQADCHQIAHLENNVSLSWRLQPRLNVVVRLEVTALDEMHLLDHILQVIYAHSPHLVLHKVNFEARSGIARIGLTLEAKDQEQIDQIAQELEQLPGRTVNEVRQMRLLFSEREELTQPMAPTIFNPYRRLPVRDRKMFFGRSEELAQVNELLHTGTGVIFVRGQKRVGKTSLLLHLKEHYLNRSSMMPIFIDFQMLGHLNDPLVFHEIANTVYVELRTDHRIGDVGPPLLELFEVAPATELMNYLQSAQSHFGSTKLVLLIDEFSRTIDRQRLDRLNTDFIDQWLGVLQATMPEVSYVMVVQQQIYDTLFEQIDLPSLDHSWHLLEMGSTLLLQPLDERDARQLIERPTHNYLEYSSDSLRYVWRLTGGSPFLIQAFCFNLVRHMARSSRRRVEWEDVDAVQEEFMHPNESIFAHLLEVMSGMAPSICQQLTRFLDETDQAVPLAELRAALPNIQAENLLRTVQDLVKRHILIQPEPGYCQFASLLFGRWLARHTVLEQFKNSR